MLFNRYTIMIRISNRVIVQHILINIIYSLFSRDSQYPKSFMNRTGQREFFCICFYKDITNQNVIFQFINILIDFQHFCQYDCRQHNFIEYLYSYLNNYRTICACCWVFVWVHEHSKHVVMSSHCDD